jgi:hypothetical protein
VVGALGAPDSVVALASVGIVWLLHFWNILGYRL